MLKHQGGKNTRELEKLQLEVLSFRGGQSLHVKPSKSSLTR